MGNMASKTYQAYLDEIKLTKMSRANLRPLDHEETIIEAVAEGMKLLQEEPPKASPEKPKPDDTKKLESKLASTSDNPYIRARIQILNKMSDAARDVIEKMEKGETKKDRRYDEFLKAVGILGDKFSA
jgi:hypothetical protein